MKLLTAKEIKKIVIGIVLSDGYIDMKNQRFELYTKEEEYAKYVYSVLSQITGMYVTIKVKTNLKGHVGFIVWTRKHAYWKNIGEKIYFGRKSLTSYITSRLDSEALAHIWMCDGYLERAKNRKTNTVQNLGWFCLEAFTYEELLLFCRRLKELGIDSVLVKKPSGFGWRPKVSGHSLQVLISLVYKHILPCYSYKTALFYKNKENADMNLSSAEHFIREYNEVDDIVRYLAKAKITNG